MFSLVLFKLCCEVICNKFVFSQNLHIRYSNPLIMLIPVFRCQAKWIIHICTCTSPAACLHYDQNTQFYVHHLTCYSHAGGGVAADSCGPWGRLSSVPQSFSIIRGPEANWQISTGEWVITINTLYNTDRKSEDYSYFQISLQAGTIQGLQGPLYLFKVVFKLCRPGIPMSYEIVCVIIDV